MMMSYFLCIFALVALPNALAIRCYYCLPGPPGNICTTVTNVTDCDTAAGRPPGVKFDACGKVSYELAFGENELSMNALTCAVKSMCDEMEKKACNEEMWREVGMNLTKCEVNCCSEDMCNCLEPPCHKAPLLPRLRRSLRHF